MDDRSPALYNLLLRRGPMANQEIANWLELSPATITHLIQSREQEGMLVELPAQDYPVDILAQHADGPHRSRRKTTFRPNPAFAHALVVDCSGSMLHFRRVGFDLGGEACELGMIEMSTPEQTIQDSANLCLRFMSQPAHRIIAIAIIRPWHASDARFGEDLPRSLAGALHKRTERPVRLIGAARAIALHDAYAGPARHLDHFLSLYLHDSVDLGIFLNGGLFDPTGPDGLASAMDGWTLPGGTTCAAALSRRAINRELEKRGHRVEHQETYRVLLQALQQPGNQDAVALSARLGEDCATLLANLFAAFTPERIFLYSPLNELGDPFRRPLFETMARLGCDRNDALTLCEDWKPAMAAGAAKAAFDRWFSMTTRKSGSLGESADQSMTD